MNGFDIPNQLRVRKILFEQYVQMVGLIINSQGQIDEIMKRLQDEAWESSDPANDLLKTCRPILLNVHRQLKEMEKGFGAGVNNVGYHSLFLVFLFPAHITYPNVFFSEQRCNRNLLVSGSLFIFREEEIL